MQWASQDSHITWHCLLSARHGQRDDEYLQWSWITLERSEGERITPRACDPPMSSWRAESGKVCTFHSGRQLNPKRQVLLKNILRTGSSPRIRRGKSTPYSLSTDFPQKSSAKYSSSGRRTYAGPIWNSESSPEGEATTGGL